MKKVIEGELLSIAHRILKMKDKDVDSLLKESKELYEKLLILKFYETNFALGLIQDIAPEELESKLENYSTVGAALEERVLERPQMPLDLIEDDYPIVIEQEESYTSSLQVNDEEVEVTSSLENKVEESYTSSLQVNDEEIEVTSSLEAKVEENYTSSLQVNDEKVEITSSLEDKVEEDYTSSLTNHSAMEVIPTIAISEKLQEDVAYFMDGKDTEEVSYSFTAQSVAVEPKEEDVQKEEVQAFLKELDAMHDASLEEEVLTPDNDVDVSHVDEEEEAVSYVQEAPKKGEGTEAISFFGLEKKEDNPFSGFDFTDVSFERVDQEVEERKLEDKAVDMNTLFNLESTQVTEPRVVRPKSVNDIYNATITVGLNDRIAFEKHLFNGSAEDFNRVLSQLNTVSSFEEAVSLIEHLVKPEYGDWKGKEDYEERFMTLVEKRFN